MVVEKGRINAGEFLLLVVLFTVGSSILIIPSSLASAAKQDAWISSVVTTIISLFFIFIYNKIHQLFPRLTYIQCNEKVYGNVLGKMFSLLFLFYFFELSTASLREIGDFMSTELLNETPIQMIMAVFILTSLIGVRLGIEVICRSALIFFPWIVFLLLILFLFLLPDVHFDNLKPILGEGVKPVINGVYHHVSLPYLQLIIFLMLMPYVKDKSKMMRFYYRGMLVGGLILVLTIFFCLLVLDTYTTRIQVYPTYTLGKKISVGDVIFRVEAIMAFIWIITMYFKLTICFYGISLGLAQLLKLRSNKILLYPLALLIFSCSIFFYQDIVFFNYFLNKTYPLFSLTVCFLLPILLLTIGMIKKKYNNYRMQ